MPPRPASARTLLLPAFKGGAKGVESPFPESTILAAPGVEFPEGLWAQRIQTPRTVGPHAHEPGLFEDAEVPRHARLMNVHLCDDVVHLLLAGAERFDNLESAGVGDRLHGVNLHVHTYVLQYI